MAEKSFPLEDTLYTAEDAQIWFATRTSGVYAGTHLPVSASGAMEVTLGPGIAWLHYKEFAGIVYGNTENKTLVVDLSDSRYNRIDRVCIRMDILNNECYAYVKKGEAAEAPVPPALQRDNIAYEISVAQIDVGAGVIGIDAGAITDERLDADVCGLMSDGVTGIDTSVIGAQVTALLNELRVSLQSVYDGVQLTNVTEFAGVLIADGWSATEPHTQSVAMAGVLGADKPFVDVDMSAVTEPEMMQTLNKAWSNIVKAEASANAVTFTAGTIPTINIPVKAKVVR